MFKKILLLISVGLLCQTSQEKQKVGDLKSELLAAVTQVKPLQEIIWGYLDCWSEIQSIANQTASTGKPQIAFSADSKFIKSYIHPEFTLVNALTKGKAPVTFSFNWHDMRSVRRDVVSAFSPDGNYLIVASASNYATVFDANKGLEVKKIQISVGDRIGSIIFSPDSALCALICKTGIRSAAIEIWDAKMFRFQQKIELFDEGNKLIFSQDNKYVASAHDIPVLNFRDLKTQTNATFELCGDRTISVDSKISALAWSPDMNILAVASVFKLVAPTEQQTKEIICWQRVNGKFVLRGPLNQSTGEPIFGPEVLEITFIAWSPDGRHLAIRTNEHDYVRRDDGSTISQYNDMLYLWDQKQKRVVSKIPTEFFAFSPDGSQIATVAYDRTIKIWQNPVVALEILRQKNEKNRQLEVLLLKSRSSCVIS